MTESLEAPGEPTLAVDAADVMHFSWPSGIAADLERFTEHRDELSVELTIRSDRAPDQNPLHSARFNLVSTQARKTLAGELQRSDPTLDWRALLEQMCVAARERYRRGDAVIDMRSHVPAGRARWLVEPFVEHGGPTVLFGDGGAGKSFLSTAIAVTAASGRPIMGRLAGDPAPTLFLDYETDADTFHERLRAICAGAGLRDVPEVYYRRQVASLRDAASMIRREVADLRIGLIVIDSLGLACGGDPQAPDVAISLFSAIRSFRVPTLCIDHVAKNAQDESKAFGSVYKHNGPRVTWRADRAQDEGESSFVVALVNHKRNNGPRSPRRAYRVDCQISADERLLRVTFEQGDLATDFPEKATLRQRILAELRDGPQHLGDVAEHLGEDVKVVSARAGEMARKGVLVRLDDHRYAVAARVVA